MPKPSDNALLEEFASLFAPAEGPDGLRQFIDKRTNARFCECHIPGTLLIKYGTTDAPLDPDTQAEYRANRDIELDHKAFTRMKRDAEMGRAFSNIVAEYTKKFDPEHPLKIVGGQHRFEAIKLAASKGVDELHGVKVYFDLNQSQRMDVQEISNTNIAVSKALIDRMRETARGSDLRSWCQNVGLLLSGKDFSSKPARGAIYVRLVRTFITNYVKGRSVTDFANTKTTPVLCPSGGEGEDGDWVSLIEQYPDIFKDQGLLRAGKEFALLVKAQQNHFHGQKVKSDYPDKALNIAVVAAWAYVAGALVSNNVRLKRHFDLRRVTSHDPMKFGAVGERSLQV